MDPEMINITLAEYEELKKDSRLLDALRAQGVDNWDGWDDALASVSEE